MDYIEASLFRAMPWEASCGL